MELITSYSSLGDIKCLLVEGPISYDFFFEYLNGIHSCAFLKNQVFYPVKSKNEASRKALILNDRLQMDGHYVQELD